MDVGIYFFPTDAGATVTEVARAAEERGFESLFVPEHSHFPATEAAFSDPATGVLPERYRRIFDPFASLAAAAAVTERIRLGTAACILPIRDVILTAKAAATVDRLSNGRFDFGVGTGWNFPELRTHGVEPSERFDRLREGVLAMTELWSKDEGEYHGACVDFDPIWVWPKPVQEPRPPIYVAGHGRPGALRALDYGDGWLPSHRGDHDMKKLTAELRAEADELGRSRPRVTFVAKSADAAALEFGLDAELDRILLPIEPGTSAEVHKALDRAATVHASG